MTDALLGLLFIEQLLLTVAIWRVGNEVRRRLEVEGGGTLASLVDDRYHRTANLIHQLALRLGLRRDDP